MRLTFNKFAAIPLFSAVILSAIEDVHNGKTLIGFDMGTLAVVLVVVAAYVMPRKWQEVLFPWAVLVIGAVGLFDLTKHHTLIDFVIAICPFLALWVERNPEDKTQLVEEYEETNTTIEGNTTHTHSLQVRIVHHPKVEPTIE